MKTLKRSHIFVCVLILSCAANVQAQDWELVWSDEFDADTLDESKWTPQEGTGAEYGLTGWGNNELQYYTDREENVFVEDGKLHIVAQRENYRGQHYTSARIRSIHKGDWRYGRFEIRAKLPKGQGIWPAIWMMPTEDIYGGWAASGEIDIMEMVAHEPDVVHGTIHYGGGWPDNRHTGSSYTRESGDFSDDFHTFALEWEEGELRWYVDDHNFQTLDSWFSSGYAFPAPFDEKFHLLMNVAVGGDWPGSPDGNTGFPQEMIIDYVRVYQKPGNSTSSEDHSYVPEQTILNQNHPNPFNPTTQISFDLKEYQNVELTVYDVLGRPVSTLADRSFAPGSHTLTLNGKDLTSGTYIYTLRTENTILSRSMMLMK